jgi:hypothetical protein
MLGFVIESQDKGYTCPKYCETNHIHRVNKIYWNKVQSDVNSSMAKADEIEYNKEAHKQAIDDILNENGAYMADLSKLAQGTEERKVEYDRRDWAYDDTISIVDKKKTSTIPQDKLVMTKQEGFVTPFAELWSRIYQTDAKFEDMQKFDYSNIATGNINWEGIAAIDSASRIAAEVFEGDEGVSKYKLEDFLKQVGRHESDLGNAMKQYEGGPARGYFQIEPVTAKDLIKNSSPYFGKKAMSYLNQLGVNNLNDLLHDDQLLESVLMNPVGSAIFAGAKTLAGSKEKGMIDQLK